jgi:hypothetical protein
MRVERDQQRRCCARLPLQRRWREPGGLGGRRRSIVATTGSRPVGNASSEFQTFT